MSNNEDLTLKDLTLKDYTVTRSSEVNKLDPQLMTDKGDQIVFHIGKLTKTKRPSKPHLSVTLHSYTKYIQLDVVLCLREYLAKTENIRHNKRQKTSIVSKSSETIPPSSNMHHYQMAYIISCANWSRAATFQKLYNRSISANGQNKFRTCNITFNQSYAMQLMIYPNSMFMTLGHREVNLSTSLSPLVTCGFSSHQTGSGARLCVKVLSENRTGLSIPCPSTQMEICQDDVSHRGRCRYGVSCRFLHPNVCGSAKRNRRRSQ